MSSSLSAGARSGELTIFERVWQDPNQPFLFRSETHGVMAVPDRFPKLPLQTVVAPRDGTAGKESHFRDLPVGRRRQLHEVADVLEEEIAQYCDEGERVIRHTEGFGVPDHPHVLLYKAERGAGRSLYEPKTLGLTAVQQTIELVTLSPQKAAMLEARLAVVAAYS